MHPQLSFYLNQVPLVDLREGSLGLRTQRVRSS